MDTRAPADDGGWPSPAAPGAGADPLELRLAAIEARMESLERTVRETVTEELHAAGDELRRAVSDLGRLLLRDLDRLTKVLAEHRDAIVDRVTAATNPATNPAASLTAEPAGSAEPAGEPAPVLTADTLPEAAKGRGEEGRWRAVPGRRKARRSPKAEPGGDTRDG